MRVLLKLSGESLGGPAGKGIDEKYLVRYAREIVEAVKAGSRKVLFVLPENSDNIYLSSRNLPEVNVITVDEINTYVISNANSLVLIDGVQDILASRIK